MTEIAPPSSFFNSRGWPYVLAAAVAACALLVRWLSGPYLGASTPYITLYAGVALLAIYAGMGPSLLAAVLGLLGANYWFMPPYYSWDFRNRVVASLMYLIVCTIIAIGGELSRRSREKLSAALGTLRGSDERLRAAHEELEALVRGMPALVWIARDPECRTVIGNKAACAFLGVTESENVSQTAPEEPTATIRHFDAAGQELAPQDLPIQRAVKTGRPVINEELQLQLPKGGRAWIFGSATPLFTAEGTVRGAISTFVDVTARKFAEAHLQQQRDRERILSETLAQLLISDNPDVVVRELFATVAAHLNVDTYFNYLVDETGSGLRLHSYAGIPEHTAREIQQLEFGQAICGTVAQTRQPLSVNDIQNSRDEKAALVRSLGITSYACNPLVSGGRLLGTLSFASHVRTAFTREELLFIESISNYAALALDRLHTTQILRKEREQLHALTEQLEQRVEFRTRELAQAETKFRGLLEAAPDAILVVDRTGKIILVNTQVEALLGYRREELLGKDVEVLLPSRFRNAHLVHRTGFFLETRKRAMGAGADLFALHKDGREIPVEISLSPLKTDEGIVVMGAIRDITERKRAEEGLRSLSGRLIRLQDDERRRIARELHDSAGQVLAALKINLSVLEAEQSRTGPVSDRLKDSVKLVTDLSQELRTMSYLLHPPLLDEVGLTSALRWYLEGFAERSQLKVDLHISDEFGRLPTDLETAVYRIVQECLTNIHRHSGSAVARVEVTRNDGKTVVEVADQGKGIPRERLAAMEAGGNLGVGMRGMRERIRQLGGRLDIKSDDQGTTVRAEFPSPGIASMGPADLAGDAKLTA